jgi:hypothetical protein
MSKRTRTVKENRQPIGVARYVSADEKRSANRTKEREEQREQDERDKITAILRSHREEQKNRIG